MTEASRASGPEAAVPTPTATPLGELLAYLAAQTGTVIPVPGAAADGKPADLKSLTLFQDTWSHLRVEKRLQHARAAAPENAGPLNSHLLALRALDLMRNTAPAYLARFLAHADTLAWLEQTAAANAPARSGAKKRTSRAK